MPDRVGHAGVLMRGNLPGALHNYLVAVGFFRRRTARLLFVIALPAAQDQA
jgi:hypothetical protein